MFARWVQEILRSPLLRPGIRSGHRTSGIFVPVVRGSSAAGKIALLERGIILSSVAYLAFETYKWKKGQTVVHASIKVDDIIEQADYLYGSGETAKLYELLSQYKDSNDAELLWRLARAARDMALVSTTPQDEKKRLIYESFDSAKKALELNELGFLS
uniref:Regulator of microtubule dynamics 1 n=1 Tax=Xenopus tropicalis TaxID=8364 RepID=A0A6I8QZ39_XENTR